MTLVAAPPPFWQPPPSQPPSFRQPPPPPTHAHAHLFSQLDRDWRWRRLSDDERSQIDDDLCWLNIQLRTVPARSLLFAALLRGQRCGGVHLPARVRWLIDDNFWYLTLDGSWLRLRDHLCRCCTDMVPIVEAKAQQQQRRRRRQRA